MTRISTKTASVIKRFLPVKRGAIAAPTAGLHFTPQILEEIKNLGATVAEITLHVGYGTFEPVRVEDLSRAQSSAGKL